jgi:hypothetical protein
VSSDIEHKHKYTNITISKQQIESFSENYRLQYGYQPNSTQLAALIENHIREEVDFE